MSENRVWTLQAYPEGLDFASAIHLDRRPTPEPADGQVTIAADWLSLDAGTRMWMTPRTDSYQPPIPLGSPVPGQVMGRVLESRAPGFAPGDLVRAFGQWADVSCVDALASGLMKLDPTVSDPRLHLGPLGMNGWTALVGIEEVGRVKAGDTVLVSAAAGATGMLAAQIAREQGARVIGIAGGPAKCAFLTEQLKLDAAIDHQGPDVEAAIAQAAPEGIDVYFENVGGPLLDAVLPNMAHYGRIAICGLMANYAQAQPGPKRFDQILSRRLQVTGFFSPDFAHRGPELTARLRSWTDAGKLMTPFDETIGLDNVLTAYARLFTGANIGKVVVRVR
ncbi:NADPH-dependent curcumin reductase CurA [Novosphingobium chloroacetimidivorans]|uniref:NADPH-dependent curcumin reductase CurA n=1 Tax=Novosphingobium chloroacetimidivorans TaxID=1428314 RepID=A0A7W7K8W0_9SPHN|nr:NADP-dependent oxidoreductase [Novosphingobium chloroacetimidivorans]MBB4858404.1 NADPH-dependent curcumin reductase CurA [Novosphingobium chloroacetimidivorans]